MTQSVAIVGAGMGGLAAAAILSNRDFDVKIFEASSRPGGKVGVGHHDGVAFDTGPSLMTLPGILDEVFEAAGTSLDGSLSLRRLDPEFRYHYADGTSIDIRDEIDATLSSVGAALGEEAAEDLASYLEYARKIWEVAGPNFIFSRAPSWRTITGIGWSELKSLTSVDPFSTMEKAISSRVQAPEIRHILRRFATYVGSDPRQAPAMLNCIAWLEIGRGGYGVEGGMYEITLALERAARKNGAQFHFEEPVRGLEMRRNRVIGVRTDATSYSADVVISNVDIGHLSGALLPEAQRGAAPSPPESLSMSGWTGLVKAKRRPSSERSAHQVLFPSDYEQDFVDIFDEGRPPGEPTVYLCAQEKAHGREGWEEHEPVFIMANAPPEPADGERDASVWEELANRVITRARDAGLLDVDDELVWRRTPADLAEAFPGSRGALYGGASNSAMAAIRRPRNDPKAVDGLLLCGGSVHPGGGVPLCLQSGRLAADVASGE